MMTEPSGRGVRGMLNELLHGREDEHDDPDGGNGRDATDHDGESGRYGAAHDPDATLERPAPGTIGSGALASSGIGTGPRPVPRPTPPASPVAGAHRLADSGNGDASLFGGRDTAPTQVPTFGPRSEQRNWAATGGAVPAPAGPADLQNAEETQAVGVVDPDPDLDVDPGPGVAAGTAASAENGRPVPPAAAPHGAGPADVVADDPGLAPDERPATAPSGRGVFDAPGPVDAEADGRGPAEPGPAVIGLASRASVAAAPVPVAAARPAAATPARGRGRPGTPSTPDTPPLERLVPLDRARELGARWDAVKGSFVDEPRDAVRQADGLVGELLDELDRMLREQRSRLEQGLDDEETTTEDLRLALRRYRSFFDRLIDL